MRLAPSLPVPPERDPAQPPADALARAATLLLLGLAALTAAPALAAGDAAAHHLRKHVRWTWTGPAIVATAPALIAAGPAAADQVPLHFGPTVPDPR